MILEGKFLLSGSVGAQGAIAGQALTGATLVPSTNVIDLGVGFNGQVDNIGVGGHGSQLSIIVAAKVASGGTNPALKAAVQTADDSDFTTNVETVATVEEGALVEGQTIVIPFPYKNRRYVRLAYTQGGTSPTNTVVAALTVNPQAWSASDNAI